MKKTRQDYVTRLGYFFDYLQVAGVTTTIDDRAAKFLERAKSDHKWAHDCLIRYINHLKNDTTRNLSGGSINNYYAPVKLFYEANTINLDWGWISKGLPPTSHVANDRSPTLDELRKLTEYPDRRIKVIVYVMASSGIRVDAWNYLKLKHLSPIKHDKTGQVIVAAKMKVYDTLPDPYYTFISGEAYEAIQEYMDFRAAHGEKITGESWVLRDKFRTTADNKKGAAGGNRSLATHPKKLTGSGVKQILSRALRAQNIRRYPLAKGERRYEFKASHGLRKFFKSNAERVMRPLNVELLMDHKTGVSDSYYRPTEQDLREDYIRAVDTLSINKDVKIATQLQKQVAELTEKSEQENYAILDKLVEKEKETESMKRELVELKALQQKQQQLIYQERERQEQREERMNEMYDAIYSSLPIENKDEAAVRAELQMEMMEEEEKEKEKEE